MSAITSDKIVLRGIDNQPGRWRLEELIEYDVPAEVTNKAGGPTLVRVLPGFETDLASTPRFLWAILPPFGRYAGAAIVHDYLYQAHEGTRKQADLVFLHAMEEVGVNTLKREMMYRAVRIFGRNGWRNGPRVGGIV